MFSVLIKTLQFISLPKQIQFPCALLVFYLLLEKGAELLISLLFNIPEFCVFECES